MADYNLNDIVLFKFDNNGKITECNIKGKIIAMVRQNDNAQIIGYLLSINDDDIPKEVKELNLKHFTDIITLDDMNVQKSKDREIVVISPIVGKRARTIKADMVVKLIRSDDDDEKEKRRQINFFFKDILTEYVAPVDSGLKYL